jgi:hypothetical protein
MRSCDPWLLGGVLVATVAACSAGSHERAEVVADAAAASGGNGGVDERGGTGGGTTSGSGGSGVGATTGGQGGDRAGTGGAGGRHRRRPGRGRRWRRRWIAAGDAAVAGDAASASGFRCNQVIGLMVTGEWYNAGFENVVDNARWEIKFGHHAYTNEWANPQSTFWSTPISSPCAMSANAPERVVFVALNWDYTTEKQWEDDVTKDVQIIRVKYPSVKKIELLTIVRCAPTCGKPPAPPGQSCLVPQAADDALAAVAAKMPDLVSVGPKFQVDACSDFPGNGTHLTDAAAKAMAKTIGTYYLAHP